MHRMNAMVGTAVRTGAADSSQGEMLAGDEVVGPSQNKFLRSLGKGAKSASVMVVLLGGAVLALLPLLWMLSTSLKINRKYCSSPLSGCQIRSHWFITSTCSGATRLVPGSRTPP